MDRKRMAEVLVSDGLLTDEQVRVAVQAHESMGRGSRFGDYLVELGLLTPRKLAWVLGRQFHLDVVSLDKVHPEPEAIAAVSRALAERLQVLPLSVADGQLTVAVSDPLDFGIPKALASESKLRVRIVLASPEEIAEGIAGTYGALAGEPRLEPLRRTAEVEALTTPGIGATGSAGDALIQLIRTARKARSIQLIFSPEDDGYRVLIRNPGGLRTVAMLPPERSAAVLSDLRVRVGLTPASAAVPREGRATLVVDGASLQVELALLPTLRGERGMLSLQVQAGAPISLEDLPVTRTNLAVIDGMLAAPGGGVMLLVGLPGEDLRTLLVGIAARMDPSAHVVAMIEEGRAPLIEGVIQVGVRPGAMGLSWTQALASALRQEPDAVLVADLRDAAAAALVFEAALSGVRVVCGMQAAGPSQALERLGQMGVEGVALARGMRALGFQRWGERICAGCRERVHPTHAELKALKLEQFDGQVILSQGRGCATCDGVGLVDAVAVQAISPLTAEDQRHLVRSEQPWGLFTRLQEALIYDAAAKAIGGYITAKGAMHVIGSM